MKRMLATAAIGLAFGASAALAHTQDQTETQESPLASESDRCQVISPELTQRLAEEPERRAEFSAQLSRDLRFMRNTALQLERYGHTEACNAVAEAIQEMIDNPAEYREVAAQSQIAGTAATDLAAQPDLTWEERQELRREEAQPITQLESRLRAGDLIGADVRGNDGDSLGEVDDLIFGQSAEESWVIVSYGGFLGFGQDLSAVPFDRVEVTPDLNTIYVPLTQSQLEDAPTFSRGDLEMLSDPEWQERNEQFYSQTQ